MLLFTPGVAIFWRHKHPNEELFPKILKIDAHKLVDAKKLC